MKLAVESCGTHGAPNWRSEPRFELWNVTSDELTEEMVADIAARLSTGMEDIVVNGPLLSDNDQTATIEVRSKVSAVHLRAQAERIRRMAEETLEHIGIEIPRH